MGKTNQPFNEIYFPITAINTVDSNSTTEVFDYLAKPFRFNDLTALQLKVGALPPNERYYSPAKGGIMKILTIENKDDLDKYFVVNLNNAEYSSILEMISPSNTPSSSRMKIILGDFEEEVGNGILPNATNILSSILSDDYTKLAHKKMTRFKDQLHNMGYWVQGFTGLGIGETVDPDLVARYSAEMLSISLLDKVNGNTPVTPDELLPEDKSSILSSSVDIDYNIQDTVLFTFELLTGGVDTVIGDIDVEDKAKIEASEVVISYTKQNASVTTITIPASILVDVAGTSTELHPAFIKAIDFDKARIISVSFSDNTIPATYTLSVLTAPTSKQSVERFEVKSIHEDEEVHLIASAGGTTELTSAGEIISVSFVDEDDLNTKFGFLFEEKDTIDVPTAVLSYMYVKLAEITIAKGFGTNDINCLSFIEATGTASITGTIFSYNLNLSTLLYDMLVVQGEGGPVTFVRSYDAEKKAGGVIDLTVDYEKIVCLAAMGKFFSTDANGGLDAQNDIFAAKTIYSSSFIDAVGLPTLEDSTIEDINLGIGTLSFATPVKTLAGTTIYYWDHPVSLIKTGEFYNVAKEVFIKAYSYNAVNSILTDAIVNLKRRMYTQELVDSLNEAINDVLSELTSTFGNQIKMTLYPLEFYEGRNNPNITTTTSPAGVRVTTLKLANIVSVTITNSLNTFTVSYETTIQA